MTNYERQFGRGSYAAYGKLPYVRQMPGFEALPSASFEGGLDYRIPGQARQNSTDDLLDVEIDERGRLRRVSGLRSMEILPYAAEQVAVHHSLDGTAELLLFAPPYMGLKFGATTQWFDLGLSESKRHFAFTNYGGTFIFSNLTDSVWVRQSYEQGATQVTSIAPARTYATFAGRVFAGGTLIDGDYEPAGIRWSAEGDYRDWEGLGSGFELLISNTVAGEEILAFVPMNFDYMAVVCRSSIWVGRRTGLRDRPVDFAPRVMKLSSVVARSVQNTPRGVIFLEEAGVMIFDGSAVAPIGEPIKAALDVEHGTEDSYHSAYDPVGGDYLLFTPSQTFVFNLATGRWTRRSLIAKNAGLMAEYAAPLRWADATGTWADAQGQWVDYDAQETDYRGLVYLLTSEGEEHLAEEDEASFTNVGIPLRPYALMPPSVGVETAESLGIGTVGIEYEGGGAVQLAWDSVEEDLARISEFTLPSKLRPYTYYKGAGVTTSSPRARLFFLSGDPSIRRITQWVQRRGRRV